jgi:hypothetical protein
MKRCPDCGTENNPYIKACVSCGRELPSAVEVAAALGLLGNYWYKLHMQRKLAALAGSGTPEQVRTALLRADGTSPVGPSLLLIAMVALYLVILTHPE